jgi:hypothetical protein
LAVHAAHAPWLTEASPLEEASLCEEESFAASTIALASFDFGEASLPPSLTGVCDVLLHATRNAVAKIFMRDR